MATIIIHEPAPSNTAIGSVLALINSAVGAGVLAFPFAFRCTGWAAGLAATFLIAALESFTLYVLSRYAEHTNTKTYSALVHKMLGGWASMLMCVVIFLYPFGSCIAYLIIVGDSFQPLLLQAFGVAWWTSRNIIITGVGCSCILPLCFRTRLGALRAVSSICVWGLMVVVGVIVYRSAQIVSAEGYSWGNVTAFNPSLQFFGALPLIVFGFHCHTNVLSVFEELDPHPVFFPAFTRRSMLARGAAPSAVGAEAGTEGSGGGASTSAAAVGAEGQREEQEGEQGAGGYQSLPTPRLHALPSQRLLKTSKLRGMVRVVVAAIGTTAIFYTCVGLSGYLAFPLDTRSNILLNFSSDDKLIQVARAAVGLIQICAYVVNHFPARVAVRDLLHQTTGYSCGGVGFLVTETLLFFGTTLGLALLCTDLGSIFKLVGGTCGSMLILTMPGSLLIQYARSKQLASRQHQLQLQLREPLLAAASASEAGEAATEQQQQRLPPRLYCLWTSKLFWSGVLLVALSAALCVVSIAAVIHPFPDSAS